MFSLCLTDSKEDNLMSIDEWQFTEKKATAPDKSKLAKVIERASKVDVSKYTEETVEKMQEAFSEAQKVYDDQEATECEIAKAVKMLEDALENLKLKENEGYKVLEGSDSKWTRGSKEGLTFKISKGKFDHLEISGVVVDPSQYTFDAENMTILVRPEYLDSLAEGVYTVAFVYSDGGEACAKLTVVVPDAGDGQNNGGNQGGSGNSQGDGGSGNGTVKTGDTANVVSWGVLLILAMFGAGMAVRAKRKK